MSKSLNIIIVEDNKPFSEALKFYLETRLNHNVIFVASTGQEFLACPHRHSADLIFMDIELPDCSGINLAKKELEEFPAMKIVAMTMYEDKVYLDEMVMAGFKGALLKSNFYKNLEKAIVQVVIDNKLFFPKNINVYKKL